MPPISLGNCLCYSCCCCVPLDHDANGRRVRKTSAHTKFATRLRDQLLEQQRVEQDRLDLRLERAKLIQNQGLLDLEHMKRQVRRRSQTR